MHETEWDEGTVGRLRGLMQGPTPGAGHGARLEWSMWGSAQRAWAELAAERDAPPTWRFQLRTALLDGFEASPTQLRALSDEVPTPTLAGLVRRADDGSRLELASSLDLHAIDLGCAHWLLTVAGRLHAALARQIAASTCLASAGLTPAVDLAAPAPLELRLRPEAVLLGPSRPPGPLSMWTVRESRECVAGLLRQRAVHAVDTPWGLSASFPAFAAGGRSLFELRSTADSLLGYGLSVQLRLPRGGGMLAALALNEREVSPQGRGAAIGGWHWTDGGLTHTQFLPDAFCPRGLATDLALAYGRRAVDGSTLRG
jgi:hypothetical protein